MSKETIKSGDVRSRRRIQDILKTEGPQDATLLAEQLGVSAMAVRQHLYALQDEGLVTYVEKPRPKGRPAKLWQLTEAADSLFPDAHADLTVGLIDAIRGTFGEDGLDKLIEVRSQKQMDDYRARLAGAKALKDRVVALVNIREQEGYMAAVTEEEDGTFLLVENHCPICVAATACSGLCAMELDVFTDVLSDLATVTRTDHILAGARRCAYRIVPKH